ncbi:MAG: PQQ-dependent sugar dehydrogenase [Chloroflexi bacterium]|nr:PQQ-dependent sugar dehydrogenase [Chloroflexota bacterium]
MRIAVLALGAAAGALLAWLLLRTASGRRRVAMLALVLVVALGAGLGALLSLTFGPEGGSGSTFATPVPDAGGRVAAARVAAATPTRAAAATTPGLPTPPAAGATPAPAKPPAAQPTGTPATPSPAASPAPLRFTVAVAASGLEVPWGLVFAPDGRAFVSERPGRIRVLAGGQLQPAPWAVLPVAHVGEGGLLGLALHPQFPAEPYLYAYYTYRAPDGRLLNRVVRLRAEGSRGGAAQTLLDDIPGAAIHDGGGLAFGPDGKLYVGTGDAAQRSVAPRPDSVAGKVLRINADGSVPADNPFVGSPVYSLGHRNVQGFAWDAQGRLYATEHGPSGEDGRCCRDEVNLIVPGGNYGWPTHAGIARDPRFRDPVVESGMDTWAPSGAAFWRGSLFVAALRGVHLRRLAFGPDGQTVVANEALLLDRYGRLRAVAAGPDGALWVGTSNRDGRGRPAPDDDRLLRLVPGS